MSSRLGMTTVNFALRPAKNLVQWELCKEGVGICIILEEIGDIEARVRRVLPRLAPIPIPMWLVCHRELRTSRRIRLVFDRLADELGA
jgi:DNA-binding transcriptional LysR family regulator